MSEKIFKSYKAQSKLNWGRTLEIDKSVCDEQIKLGAILRIADSLELIAKNYRQLIEERDRYKLWYENQTKYEARLLHRIAGLKGYINRKKKK